MNQNPLENQKSKEIDEREKRSEIFLRFLHSAEKITALHGKKIEEIFSSEEEKRTFIENLKPDEFIELLNGINGILRGKKKEEWSMDGEGVMLSGAMTPDEYLPPKQEDKKVLLDKLLFSAKEMSRSGRDLKDVALLVSASLNAIHPFSDGNGRTSRLVYSLLTENFNDAERKELAEILGKYGREKFDINPGFIGFEIDELIEKDIGLRNVEVNKENITNLFYTGTRKDLQFHDGIYEKDKVLFRLLLEKDNRNLLLSVFQYLQSCDDREKYLNKFSERTAIRVDWLLKDLTQENLNKILEKYQEIKRRHVEILLDCIANPSKEEYQIDHNGQKISLKDYFELKIKENSEKNKE